MLVPVQGSQTVDVAHDVIPSMIEAADRAAVAGRWNASEFS
jgi:hypothetical protein